MLAIMQGWQKALNVSAALFRDWRWKKLNKFYRQGWEALWNAVLLKDVLRTSQKLHWLNELEGSEAFVGHYRNLCAASVYALGLYVRAYPDVSVLVVPGKVQHVIQSQHAWRNLGEIHSWIHMVLRETEVQWETCF